ncbi:MAG: hypothetical protein ABIH72_02285 [archaeon]
MGSVKDLITRSGKLRNFNIPKGLYIPPLKNKWGQGAWDVSGRFSVLDLKEQIPETEIRNKAEILAMQTAHYFEALLNDYHGITQCYRGMLNHDGNVTTCQNLLDKGELSNIIVMSLSHSPETYWKKIRKQKFDPKSPEQLIEYRRALRSGRLKNGIADVESIFRKGFPLGSSTFKKIFEAVGMKEDYLQLATYDEVVNGLDEVRKRVENQGIQAFPGLEGVLAEAQLDKIPNPGYILKGIATDSTTKFEKAGDRAISRQEAQHLSGMDPENYAIWAESWVPLIAAHQIAYSEDRGILNIDGKLECVVYYGRPCVTDFANTIDENRTMILYQAESGLWAIPSNKEIQRAIFRAAGVPQAIERSRALAKEKGGTWQGYFEKACQEFNIDVSAVTEESVRLMEYAAAEIGNRTFQKNIFDAPPLSSWAPEFLPYASKIEYQE